MIGAVIFVIFFLLGLGATLAMPSLPPGNMVHSWLNIPMTDYPVLGIPAWLLINAIVNGLVYGFIVWLVYSIIRAATGKGEKTIKVEVSPPSSPSEKT